MLEKGVEAFITYFQCVSNKYESMLNAYSTPSFTALATSQFREQSIMAFPLIRVTDNLLKSWPVGSLSSQPFFLEKVDFVMRKLGGRPCCCPGCRLPFRGAYFLTFCELTHPSTQNVASSLNRKLDNCAGVRVTRKRHIATRLG